MKKLFVWFNEVGKDDVGLVGGKGANLGEMTRAGIPVPPGFIVTSQAWYEFLDETGLRKEIKKLITNLDVQDTKKLQKISSEIKWLITSSVMPKSISESIKQYYAELSNGENMYVAVRSSATAEDLPEASFAGQQATFLNVIGPQDVARSVQQCWASLFEARAIYYREEQKFDHFKVGIAVPVQKMVQSDVSGIMFSIDPLTNDTSTILIEAIYGLGEYIVGGIITPDQYEVDKNSLAIKSKIVVSQTHKLIKTESGNEDVEVVLEWQGVQKLWDESIPALAELSRKLEQHYGKPQDSEWALENGVVYIVQTRPITTVNSVNKTKSEELSADELTILKSTPILKGASASPGVAAGPVKIIHSPSEIDQVAKGDILVTEMTTPDFVPAMKRASAIVTNLGGRTCHAAIVSRELGIPCVVGTGNATTILKSDQVVTVNGAEGTVFEGGKPHVSTAKAQEKKLEQETGLLKTKTKIYVNLGEPELAKEMADKHVDGIGLLRAEFMIAGIGVHPKKIIKEGRQQEFIDRLANDLKKFCEAFDPRPVIYRATDFKTNEYRSLDGGDEFEPQEPNPMLGFRGCYRYIKEPEVFRLEIEAIKKVRNEFGYKNLHLMIPFVRTIEELVKVKHLMHEFGLRRSPTFKLLMMVEIPSNVLLLDEFLDVGVDGVSIGSNDLTMLILGTDRDNSEVASEFDERNEAVMLALEHIVKTCKKHKVICGICGQAPSVYPEITQKLVEWGVTSVSVSPDMISHTRKLIYDIESKR
ncbi:MAG: phosphoenolpyruvate synthase [bacterium]|nr:phosphoenolpyruvate synthase [bacterium]